MADRLPSDDSPSGTPSLSEPGDPSRFCRSKEDALVECSKLHLELIKCMRSCGFGGFCCQEEHAAFWTCYKQERGVNQTRIGARIDSWIADARMWLSSPAAKEAQAQAQAADAKNTNQ
ncbi:hypothetical protein WJX72_003485 [[Myrmecia] bisecta]|uniref:COX assembly mitochondrial protein n=1 Tax=[Myrmecia] bisecta TaxID=41462 RepID=A0AAW1QR24_9CHLO